MSIQLNSTQLEEFLKITFTDCADLTMRKMIITEDKSIYAAYIGNLSDRTYITDSILKPLIASKIPFQVETSFLQMVSSSTLEEVADQDQAISKILAGNAVIFTDSPNSGCVIYTATTKSSTGRSINEPDSEVVVRGPREGFIESADLNVALLRKRIKTPDLKVKKICLGQHTKTDISIVYLKNVADENVLATLMTKLQSIKLPGIIDSGYIEHYIEETTHPLFSAVGNSEKPDKIAAKILEGRIAIVCDGSPVVLTVPYLFVESIQSAEDYLKTPYYATFIRFLRLSGMFLSFYLPAIYITLLEHHKGAIPFELYLTIAKARKAMPFSVFTEIITVLLIFELIREVGLRMPKAIGDAVSIVGGIILGDAAIKAGIASAPVIMVGSLTVISSFMNPPFMNSTVLIRLFNIVLAKLFGIVGIIFAILFLLVFLCQKTSYGMPYLSPFAPVKPEGFVDGLLMIPKNALQHESTELKK